jgi:solute:Na+ symporter, SSS family
VAYLLSTVLIGYWVSHRASQSMQNYFLGGNTMPWYMLGISNASGMFDISGTMLLVSWMFVYGLKSVWIPWLWPTFNQIFLMVYLSAWLRRSKVMTGAEWIKTRFGTGRGAQFRTSSWSSTPSSASSDSSRMHSRASASLRRLSALASFGQ